MPRHKVPEGRRHVARGISLPPILSRQASRRANGLEISFSRYVQRLIEADLADPVLAHVRVGRAPSDPEARLAHARAVAAHHEEAA